MKKTVIKPEELRKMRAVLGLTQSEMADIVGVTYSQWSRYESNNEATRRNPGRLVIDKLEKLAKKNNLKINMNIEKLVNINPSKKSEEFKRIRNELNLTQEEICDLIGINQSGWSSYENGRRDASRPILSRLIKLTKKHNIKIDLNLLVD